MRRKYDGPADALLAEATNCDTARAASDGQCAESEMTLRLIRTTLGRCGALRVYEHTVADTRQEVQTVTTWDEPGAHVVRITWLSKRQALVASLVNASTAKRLSCRTRPSGDPSIPLREPLLSSLTTPRPVPPGTGGGRKSCRRTQRTYRAAPARSLSRTNRKRPISKQVSHVTHSLTIQVGRQSTALALERLKRLARQAQGKR